MYLSKITVQNYRGIRNLEVSFNKDINILIGENARCKTAVIDALRLLYSMGDQQRSIWVSQDDFYIDVTQTPLKHEEQIILSYEFRDLSALQKGALYEYLVLGGSEDYAKITLIYEEKLGKVHLNYYSGELAGQKPDSSTFDLFQHYYLGALRDSTRDLLASNKNILGQLLQRVIEREKKDEEYETLIGNTNKDLLKKQEITKTRTCINNNLDLIFKKCPENRIGLNVEQTKLGRVVGIIKPFLPHDRKTLEGEGFSLRQNSLGYNNLVYIATVLGDIEDIIKSETLCHFALLIEEPEAHLHPQLQLCLYDFLSSNSESENSQLFITTHSPTLTSKVPLDHLILLKEKAYRISDCFKCREDKNIEKRRKQLERYLDVTRSQLFFSRGALLVEGISEGILIPIFCKILGYSLEDYRIELVNVNSTSFYPFLDLFNSPDEIKKIPIPVSVLTDDDRFTDSKKEEYSFDNIVSDQDKLNDLLQKIKTGEETSRIVNLKSAKKDNPKICISAAYKTFEFEIAKANISSKKEDIKNNDFVRFVKDIVGEKYSNIELYIDALPVNEDGKITDEQKDRLAILFWKVLPNKAEFAQEFSIYLADKPKDQIKFNIPEYVITGLDNLTRSTNG